MLVVQIQYSKAQKFEVLNETYTNLHKLKSLSYSTNFTEENPFNPGDFSKGIIKTQISYGKDGVIDFRRDDSDKNSGQIVTNEIYKNGKRYTFNLTDSTYAVDNFTGIVKDELHGIISAMLICLGKEPSKVLHNNDTLYNGRMCYQFLIKAYDTIAHGNHDYTFKTILIDKISMMPLYYKEIGSGAAFKDGYEIGRLKFFIEKAFTDFKLNQIISSNELNFDGFQEVNKSMLRIGETAPLIDATPISNAKLFWKNSMKLDVKLVVFGSTTCSANPLSNPMLNRLHSKYAGKNFYIVNVYTGDTVEQISQYIKNNHINFPVFFGTRSLSLRFKTIGTPNFYLIDWNDKIVASIDGFSDSLEEELTTKINNLIRQHD
ncbi:hypothetical protein GCM10008119_23090 [Pedobacter mendelii]|uniref:Thioredoxin domain-containing protein n=2 Tax=Pedobacter mendelii TaxID=1908240 RepID=A0ABQ2BKX7_9SPHI|nr:hypothetical protein GCM10008119_23090 [Pedobacter mendelii]